MGQEPTNHVLRDIAKVRQTFERWKRPVVLLFEDEAAAAQFRAEDYGLLPSSVIYGIDRDGKIRQQIVKNMRMQSDRLLPIFIIADTFNRVVFQSQGYTIGLGEPMEKVILKLGE